MRLLPPLQTVIPSVRFRRSLWIGDVDNGLVMVPSGVFGAPFLAGGGQLRSLYALRFPELPGEPEVSGAPRCQLAVAWQGTKEMK